MVLVWGVLKFHLQPTEPKFAITTERTKRVNLAGCENRGKPVEFLCAAGGFWDAHLGRSFSCVVGHRRELIRVLVCILAQKSRGRILYILYSLVYCPRMKREAIRLESPSLCNLDRAKQRSGANDHQLLCVPSFPSSSGGFPLLLPVYCPVCSRSVFGGTSRVTSTAAAPRGFVIDSNGVNVDKQKLELNYSRIIQSLRHQKPRGD